MFHNIDLLKKAVVNRNVASGAKETRLFDLTLYNIIKKKNNKHKICFKDDEIYCFNNL